MVKRLIVVAVLILGALVGAAFFLGILDWQTTETKLRVEASKATSQVKSAINEGVSAPSTGGSVEDAVACRNNLKRIESAKRAAAERLGLTTSSVSWDAVLKEMGGKRPSCPNGGEYSLGNNQVNARCSVSGNGTTAKEDDHLLANY